MVAEGTSAHSGEVLRKVVTTSRAWYVSMFVYFNTASQVREEQDTFKVQVKSTESVLQG
jgi:hypothetical protein